jgi:ActR/RegA family two-component response regulator
LTDVPVEALRGRRLLIVEDDYFIAADLARSLEKLGLQIIGPVGSVRDALDLVAAEGEALDGAVLDIHLGDERAFPIADALTGLCVPFVFVTGYDAVAIPEPYASRPRCEKPVDRDLLLRTLRKAGVR